MISWGRNPTQFYRMFFRANNIEQHGVHNVELITLAQAAEIAGVKKQTILSWVDRGSMPRDAIKRIPKSRVVRIDSDKFLEWLDGLHAGSK